MSFDLDAYRRTVQPVVYDDIDFSVFVERPLSPETLRRLDLTRHVAAPGDAGEPTDKPVGLP